jgi:diguanylate cyclase (GGDEF)-like protein
MASLVFGSLLLFIHYNEFTQAKVDIDLERQKKIIDTDALTGMRSRYAYNEKLLEYGAMETLPEDLVVYSIDLNGLKAVNDSKGHMAGDEMIRGAATCLAEAVGSYGDCFRTGGDEFVVIARMPRSEIDSLIERVDKIASQWQGQQVDSVRFSVGYAAAVDYPQENFEELIKRSDIMMYDKKEEYYRLTGLDTRRK